MNLLERKQEMYELIDQWQCSGLSQTAFCKQAGIARTTLRNWLHKRQQEDGLVSPDPGDVTTSASFVPIEVSSETVGQLTITYPNGVQLSCPTGIGPDQLRGLVHLLD